MDAGATVGGAALSPLPLGGRRRSAGKKLRLVKKKTVRRMLKGMGLKMRGGAGEPAGAEGADAASTASPVGESAGGRRRRGRKTGRKSARRSRKLFGMF